VRVAVLGQGSIGRRHAGLLVEMGHEVIAFDPVDQAEVPGVTRAASEEAALDGSDAALVATPSSEHLRQARLALEADLPVLVEKPLATSSDGVAELERLAAERGLQLGVAMNLRFHPGVARLRELKAQGALGRILRAACWCGSWLPGWRPGSDYRTSYSARKALGGGVLLDAIHELDYLTWLLGPARSVSATLAQVSDLEIDVEDVALLQLEMDSGAVATVALDYFDRDYNRGCRLVGAEATAEEKLTPADIVPTYAAELEAFLDSVRNGGSPSTTVGEARHVLEIVDAARRSAEERRRVDVG
jgi:predicted dehydrogenase